MGAEREDTDLNPRRVGTEPGLGGTPSAESGETPAASSSDAPEAVDFDALHAALGDPLHFEELPPAATEINGSDVVDELDPDMAERVGESSGRSSATYSSSRPHTIPPSYSPSEDLNAPPVIVASEDTVPSAPPQMTVRVAQSQHPIAHTPQSGVPFPVGPAAGAVPQHSGHPTAPPGAPYPRSPQPLPLQRGLAAAQMTQRMPERPLNSRHRKTPTLVVRSRGPSAKQKLVAFMAMLLLVTACGIAVIIWRKPRWLGLDPNLPLIPTSSSPAAAPSPSESSGASTAPLPSNVPVVATASASAAAPASASANASAAPSAAPPVRVIRPRPAATAVPGLAPTAHSSAPAPTTHSSASRF